MTETQTPRELGTADDAQTLEIVEAFMLGELIKRVSRPFKEMGVVWSRMSEEEQEKLMLHVADVARGAVNQAVTCIASSDRVNFLANVEKVEFKADGVKAQLSLPNSTQAHALADAAGSAVLIVIHDSARYLGVGDATAGEADNKSLDLG
jgi:hypothetical protein